MPTKEKTLGANIKAARLRAKLTQRQVAEALGVFRLTVVYWESDRNPIDTRMLFRLAALLNTTAKRLMP